MTFNYNNVYIKETSTISGHLEKEGNYGKYFDKSYKDYYMNEKSFEKAEVKIFKESIDILLKKINKKSEDINLLIGGDLSNQIAVSCYGSEKFNIPFIGVYTACATSIEQIILESGKKLPQFSKKSVQTKMVLEYSCLDTDYIYNMAKKLA